jgi:hypothetical protein
VWQLSTTSEYEKNINETGGSLVNTHLSNYTASKSQQTTILTVTGASTSSVNLVLNVYSNPAAHFPEWHIKLQTFNFSLYE